MKCELLYRPSGHISVTREGFLSSRNMEMGLIWRKFGDQSLRSKCTCVVARLQGFSYCHRSISMCFHLGGEMMQLPIVQPFPNEVMLT